MKNTLTLLLIFIPSLTLAEDFDTYLKKFFADSTFQKAHVTFPLQGHYTYICDSEPGGLCLKDTIFANKKEEWRYLGYGYGTSPNISYRKSNKCPKKESSKNECIYIELSEEESCYNLQLYFKKVENTWQLIYMWDFVL